MKSKAIEETLEAILRIDIEAALKEKEKQTLTKKFNQELLDEKREVEREHFREARKNAKIKRESIINEMNETVANINISTEKEVERLKYLLENNIDEITGKIFNKILKNI